MTPKGEAHSDSDKTVQDQDVKQPIFCITSFITELLKVLNGKVASSSSRVYFNRYNLQLLDR